MAKKTEKKQTGPELLQEMHSRGIEQVIPGTGRHVRLRTLDAPTLLKEGKMPDILTPLVIKSVYQELADKELREFLGQNRGNLEGALSLFETIDFVAEKAIADGTKVKELTLAEKRWIFRLAMSPAEVLITFRYDEDDDVADVVESDEVQPVAQPGDGR